MPKVFVLYYSAYGHPEAMAKAVAEGDRETSAKVDVWRVLETVPEAIAKAAHFKLEQTAPVAKVADLATYDAIIANTRSERHWGPSGFSQMEDQK